MHIRGERKSAPVLQPLQPYPAALGIGRSDPGPGLPPIQPPRSTGCLKRRTVFVNSHDKLSDEAGPPLM